MAGDIFHRIRKFICAHELHNRNLQRSVTMIEDLCLEIANKVFNQLRMPSRNRSAATSFDVELRREQNHITGDPLSYVQSNIPKTTLEEKGIYVQIMKIVNNGVGYKKFLDAPGGACKTYLIT